MKELVKKEDFRKFVDSFDTFLFDCDGVIWSGHHVIPNVQNVLSLLRTLVFLIN
jgi:4-nitrophenyl phosphatase